MPRGVRTNSAVPNVKVLADEWTVVTADGALSAQFEHTVLVTSGGCEVLTPEPRGPWSRAPKPVTISR